MYKCGSCDSKIGRVLPCFYCLTNCCKNCLNKSTIPEINNICKKCIKNLNDEMLCDNCKNRECWECYIIQEKIKPSVCKYCVFYCKKCLDFKDNKDIYRCRICKIKKCLCSINNGICDICYKK